MNAGAPQDQAVVAQRVGLLQSWIAQLETELAAAQQQSQLSEARAAEADLAAHQAQQALTTAQQVIGCALKGRDCQLIPWHCSSDMIL